MKCHSQHIIARAHAPKMTSCVGHLDGVAGAVFAGPLPSPALHPLFLGRRLFLAPWDGMRSPSSRGGELSLTPSSGEGLRTSLGILLGRKCVSSPPFIFVSTWSFIWISMDLAIFISYFELQSNMMLLILLSELPQCGTPGGSSLPLTRPTSLLF